MTWKCTLVVVLMQLVACGYGYGYGYGRQLFEFHLLINPGLSSASNASTIGECIDRCASTATGTGTGTGTRTCSAVSFNPNSQQCVMSYCGVLHLLKNNGWNSFVLKSVLVESFEFTAPTFEWMLTDACGFSSTGIVPGVPGMILNGGGSGTFNPSQSVLIGNALHMSNSDDVYPYSGPSGVFNVDLSKGLTMSGWFYYETAASYNAFIEFGLLASNSWTIGMHFWYYNGGLFVNSVTSSGFTVVWPYTPPTRCWLHFAMTFNQGDTKLQFYVNGTSKFQQNMNVAQTSHATWSYVSIGKRPKDSASALQGNLYCIKYHSSVLTPSDIWSNAKACHGRLRIS